MAGLEVMEADAVLEHGYRAPWCEAVGPARSALFQPAAFSLWELEAELGAGAELRWGAAHGDEVVYVLTGELDVAGSRCGPGAAAIIEADVVTTARVLTDARILHFGPVSPEPPTDGPSGPASPVGHGVHVVGLGDAIRLESADGEHGSLHYADSTCETCRVAFFENYFGGPYVVSSHTHSQDEIIRMTSGELHMGRVTLRAGMSVAILGGHRYGFRAPAPFSFLNYRRDLSMYVAAPGSDPMPETAEMARRVRSGEMMG